jgi:hypothetical protein
MPVERRTRVTWKEYCLALFQDIDKCGKNEQEQFEIIVDLLQVCGSIDTELKKFDDLKSQGKDIKTVAELFGKTMKFVGVYDFEGLVDFKQMLLAKKSK